MHGCLSFLAVFLFAIAAEGDQPRFKITTKKQDDTVAIRADKDKTLFIVKSPSGIPNACIASCNSRFPPTSTGEPMYCCIY